ncbi:MAG: hypothetical protein JWR60_3977 [Polaromonas sp.]|nr:hypothetical protein [Polaromonas sp.]
MDCLPVGVAVFCRVLVSGRAISVEASVGTDGRRDKGYRVRFVTALDLLHTDAAQRGPVVAT